MKLTIQLQLLPTAEQAALLLDTMRRVNEAATFAARLGFEAGVFSQPSVHKLAYFPIREKFKLGAQLAVRAIGKAVECFSRDKTKCPVFRADGAITYDQRNMRFKGLDQVSLATLKGREIFGLVYGEYQAERFDHCEKANRKSQDVFLCQHCGYSMNADHNAALNISALGRSAYNAALARALEPSCKPASKAATAQVSRKAVCL